jgi:predicted ester cyclase
MVAEGDKVATRKAYHATHQELFLGVPASNKKVVMQVIDIVRVRDGQFIEHWNVVDMQNVMMQIKE